MRKRTLIRDVRNAIPDRALDLASRLGDGFRNGADGAGRWFHDAPGSAGHWLQGAQAGAGKWLQAGMAVGAARTGARAVGTVARRHPVALGGVVEDAIGFVEIDARRSGDRFTDDLTVQELQKMIDAL